MNPQTYAQMLELQQQKGAPLTSQGQGPMQQQAPAGAQRYDSTNPLSEGSMAAVNAARQSMSGAAPKKRGFFDNLLRMAQAASVAKLRSSRELPVQNYGNMLKTPDESDEAMRAQEAARASENFKMMQFLQANENMRQKHSHSQAILNEQRRHHDMQSRHQGAHSDYYRAMADNARNKNSKDKGDYSDLPTGAIPYSSMTPTEKNLWTKNMMERAHRPVGEKKVLDTMKTLHETVKDYPDLSKDLSAALLRDKYTGPVTGTIARKFMDKEKRKRLEVAEKLAADLALKDIKSLGSVRANMFLEKLAEKANPNTGLSPEAIFELYEHRKKQYPLVVEDSKLVRKGMSSKNRYAIPEEFEEVYAPPEDTGNVSNLSNEEKIEMARKMGLVK